ncbi:DUF3574 domain-containing protein [Rhodopila sp.]|uniref:DUF3574 domain-containing protein n=1 Tax=Rhodopila sp. TaxID=2480087 RepID=UPI003D0AF847
MIAALTGCITPPNAVCSPGLGPPMLMFDLFFGRAIAGRSDLTEGEWQDFLDDVVTVNLPNGYTVVDASGAWMNPITHKTITEPSRVILVAMPETPDSLAAINRIRTAYQIRFDQQLVGMTVARACGSF